jgi:predicted Zn finger-like uncharacterized protein
MQIVCPNCKTSYQLADIAIGANGRSVRCVRCRTLWRAMPPAIPVPAADETAAVAAFRSELGAEPPALPDPPVDIPTAPPTAPNETPPEPSLDDLIGVPAGGASAPAEAAPIALSDIPIPVDDAPPLVPAADGDGARIPAAEIDNGPPDIESVAARRARTAARKRRNRWRRIPLPVAIVALIAISGGLLSWRKDVVRYVPQLASFYSAIGMPVNLRGLAFTDLKIGNEIHDGVPVLVVEGLIVNMVSTPADIPRIRFALRNATGAEVYSWTAQPSQPVLGAFETLPFRSRLASPPAEGHDIQVRFFTRRDAVAGLR